MLYFSRWKTILIWLAVLTGVLFALPNVVSKSTLDSLPDWLPKRQLTLGLDRDSGLVAASFDERNPAVLKMLDMAISACRKAGKYVGICGQGPSDHPDLAKWLLERGIGSLSLNPDTVIDTWLYLAGQGEK